MNEFLRTLVIAAVVGVLAAVVAGMIFGQELRQFGQSDIKLWQAVLGSGGLMFVAVFWAISSFGGSRK